MKSSWQRSVAIVLAIGAILMAVIGYRQNASLNAVPQKKNSADVFYQQIVAARSLPADHVLSAMDVKVVKVSKLDSTGFYSTSAVIGKLTKQPISAGEIIKTSQFVNLSPIAQKLLSGERGVAIRLNDAVVGLAGFGMPGDYVDVLLYLRGDKETNETSSAQVILKKIRLLAVGDKSVLNGSDNEGVERQAINAVKGVSSDGSEKKEVKPLLDARYALLAIPEDSVSKLMLAENRGVIRLVLRGVEKKEDPRYAGSQYLEVADLTAANKVINSNEKKITSGVSKHTGEYKKNVNKVTVYRGDAVEIVNSRD